MGYDCPKKPVDCMLSDWIRDEGGCSKSCGGGIQKWSKHIIQPRENAGKPCSIHTTVEIPCNLQACSKFIFITYVSS